MIIDTHAHLTGKYAAPDEVADIVARAAAADVGRIVCATAHPDDWADAIGLAARFDNVFTTIGIHPEYAGSDGDSGGVSFANPKIIGIGEIGLDYHYGAENRAAQIELFEHWLNIARRENLPVAIHSRDAEEDTMAILDGKASGVLHSFTGSWNMAKTMLDRGFYISANGILTFKNADDLRDVFDKIPTDRIVVETDAPWLAPVPYRGKKCEPFMVTEVVRVLSQIKNIDLPDLETILEQNTRTLYPKLG
jgi:TatD DNase family protein